MIRQQLEHGLHSRNGVVRKASAALLQIPKQLARRSVRNDDYRRLPPVLANSFPKSGTHLLDQIVTGLPGRVNYGAFLSSMTSSFRMTQRSEQNVERFIERTIPGEIVRAHLFHTRSYEPMLRSKNFVHYFIYRDPRDVVVSAAHYVRTMNRWHRLHKYFRACNDMEEAVLLAIRGLKHVDPAIPLANVAERFNNYAGWLETDDVMSLRFEDLIGPDQDAQLRRIVEFYLAAAEEAGDLESILDSVRSCIAPEKSHTYRQGVAARWKSEFTPRCVEAFKEVAGDLLITLGYERDQNWSAEQPVA